jgi:ATP-binding cassette subfamily F protein 3
VLGCFLFTDEDQFKKIKVLSGGEKSRVALAKTLISEANFLLLDEPTNHLDFISENILIQALQQYQGSFVVVSHNRHFVSQIANKIWYIEDQQIKEYPGTYDEYEYWRKKNEANAQLKVEPKVKVQPTKKEEKPKTPSTDAKLKALEKDLKKSEALIDELEQQKKKLEAEMAKPEVYSNFEMLRKIKTEFDECKKALSQANTEWENIVTRIDEIK